ncbi:MAG: c-type cytochrome [Chitinophagaceae bacterium]|nr:c-type cytochrome [Chitinophagaceae bacterium]
MNFPLKKWLFIISAFSLFIACASRISNIPAEYASPAGTVPIPAHKQFPGNAEKGFTYLTEGDYLKSGIPVNLFKQAFLAGSGKPDLGRQGDNKGVPYDFTVITAPNGAKVGAPNCMFCHAQTWGDSVIIGLGNSLSDYSLPQQAAMAMAETALKLMNEKDRAAATNFIRAGKTTAPYLTTASKGVNIADRLTAVLAAHRDPKSFVWRNEPGLALSKEVIPTDVPAWWLLKKKNAMFYSGFGRGDFPRFLMAANLLTVTDTAEAAEVLTHFDDVLAYIYSIKPPKYPKPIDQDLASKGKPLFDKNCAKCHGKYGADENYPNLLVPLEIIKTDSALVESNFSSPQFLDWFRQSWFRTGERKADLVPFKGYIAPPLDGVWITAPYLHNGSVPNLETLLNSKTRPVYWERSFDKPEYDYEKVGWIYKEHEKQINKSTYNTTLRGYNNHGHTFGDKLNDIERKAVIEYLKTL